MKTLNQKLQNITSQFYFEEVSKEAALKKIESACKNNGVKFFPELIVFDMVQINGGSELSFSVDWSSKLEKSLGVSYDDNRVEFAIAFNCYSAATFAINRKWYDQSLARCVKFYYTGGVEFLTNLMDIDPLSSNHYLTASKDLKLMSRADQVEAIYFN